jgi:outer membrane protein assembly factor BamB
LATVAVLAIGSWVGAAEKTADAWIEFRGPTGQGHSAATNLPTQWGPEQNVAWKVALPGQRWSSPIYDAGHLYLTTAVTSSAANGDAPGETPADAPLDSKPEEVTAPPRLSLRLLCLAASTGAVQWDVEVFGHAVENSPRIHNKNSHASPTPVLRDGKLYVHFGHQGTACVDLKGNILWRNNRIQYEPVHGNGGSPALTPEAMIFSCDGAQQAFVVALDRTNGEELWRADRQSEAAKKFSFTTPLLIETAGGAQLISPGSDVVCALDPDTGRELWRVHYDGYSVIPRPVFGHGMVYVCTGFGRPELLAIRPDGSGDVTETHVAWKASKGVPLTPSLLLDGDALYMVSDRGVASCLDAKTGDMHWQERLGGGFSASPLLADAKIYFQNEQGVGTVISPGTTYQHLATNDLGERTLASYAVSDGALYIRTEGNLYCVRK